MLLTDYLIYSLKVAALMAVFYLFWRLLLERETLHRLNRMVLLGTAVGSFVLPMCVITFHQVEMIPVETGVVTANHWVTEAVAEPTLWERWSGAVGALLLVVTVLMLLHLIYNIWQLHRFIGRCELHTTADGVRIAVSDEPIVPSSWMRTIMLSRNDYAELSPALLAHERSHIRHHHSCDVLLVELVTALQWFNPVVWMIRQDLRTVHEYEADAAVIGSGTDMRTYFNMLIQKATGRGAYSMANGISNSTLKKRFKRMLKKKSNRWCGAKALYVIPVVALSLAATAKTIVEYRQVQPTDDEVQSINVENGERVTARAGDNLLVTFKTDVTGPNRQRTDCYFIKVPAGTRCEVNGKSYVESSSVRRYAVTANHIVKLDGKIVDRNALPDIPYTALAKYEQKGNTVLLTTGFRSNEMIPSDSKVLVFVDGKEVSYDQFKQLKSEQIESMTVLKDEKSTAAYGEKGKNGVILITLKKAKNNSAATKDGVVTYGSAIPETTVIAYSRAEQYPQSVMEQVNDDDNSVYDVCEVLPEYPGGMEAMMKFVSENVKYPAEAQAEGISGRVVVSFVVKKNGKIADVRVSRSVDPSLDAEAIRVVNLMPKWKPGRSGGKKVDVMYHIPVMFKLQA